MSENVPYLEVVDANILIRCHKCHAETYAHISEKQPLRYFTCSKCGLKLALTRYKNKDDTTVKVYIDDVEHMGFLTSGPGGY
jgi:DNA-directed RNA polymerase subunit RPC12/RpoP